MQLFKSYQHDEWGHDVRKKYFHIYCSAYRGQGQDPVSAIIERAKLQHPLIFEEKQMMETEAVKKPKKADSWAPWRKRNNISLP